MKMSSRTQYERDSDQIKRETEMADGLLAELDIGTEAELVRCCQDVRESLDRRVKACRAVGYLRVRMALPALINLAGDDATEVDLVWAAGRALWMLGSFSATR